MNISVTIPTSLSEITLRDYQKFLKLAEGREEDQLLQQEMVMIFCHIPFLAVTKMQRKDFVSITNTLVNVLRSCSMEQEKKDRPKFQPIITLKGTKYGFIPSLQDDHTMGEFVDLDNFMKSWDTMHKAMAVMYRPITIERGHRYLIEKYTSRKEILQNNKLTKEQKLIKIQKLDLSQSLMVDVTMDVVMGAMLFFWTLSSQLLTITPKYLEMLLTKNPTAVAALEQNGVGISTYTSSLEEASLKLRGLLTYTWARPYSFLHTIEN